MSDTIQAAERLMSEGMGAIDRPMWVAKAVVQVCREYLAAAEQLEAILALARQCAHPGCNPGAHGLASEILRIVGERE